MELELVISVPDTNWISGESPTFSAVLINRGSEDVELPDAYAADMFSVSITDQASGLTRTIAPGELLFARNPDRKLPQFPVDVVPLAPGEQRDYLIDLNTYLNTPLVVGVHDILASYDTGEQKFDSAAITVTVAPLQAVSIVSSPEASARVLYQLVMHAEADSLTVLTRKSEINYPGEGGLVRAGEGVLPGASAAFATQVQALISHRHFAIHDSGALRFGEHSRGYHPTTSAPLSDAASLHPIGWQIDEWTSEFVALAAEGSGVEAVVTQFQAEIGRQASQTRVALPLDKVPEVWSLRRDAHQPVWTLVYAEGAEVQALRFDLTEAGTPRALTTVPGPVSRLALQSIAGAPREAVEALPDGQANYTFGPEIDAVDIVFGPIEWQGNMRYGLRRVLLEDGTVQANRVYALSAAETPEPLDWALSRVTGPAPIAVARQGDRLISIGAEDTVTVLQAEEAGTGAIALDWFVWGYVLSLTNRLGNLVWRTDF